MLSRSIRCVVPGLRVVGNLPTTFAPIYFISRKAHTPAQHHVCCSRVVERIVAEPAGPTTGASRDVLPLRNGKGARRAAEAFSPAPKSRVRCRRMIPRRPNAARIGRAGARRPRRRAFSQRRKTLRILSGACRCPLFRNALIDRGRSQTLSGGGFVRLADIVRGAVACVLEPVSKLYATATEFRSVMPACVEAANFAWRYCPAQSGSSAVRLPGSAGRVRSRR